ncbi:hypothetical protein [uncultured Friedmanniella sp.]|uniref:hypothetical protein n=1 Tax=uncultured Friedmanniella sp. TaxID=335381 RepID=UPI0035CC5698
MRIAPDAARTRGPLLQESGTLSAGEQERHRPEALDHRVRPPVDPDQRPVRVGRGALRRRVEGEDPAQVDQVAVESFSPSRSWSAARTGWHCCKLGWSTSCPRPPASAPCPWEVVPVRESFWWLS